MRSVLFLDKFLCYCCKISRDTIQFSTFEMAIELTFAGVMSVKLEIVFFFFLVFPTRSNNIVSRF